MIDCTRLPASERHPRQRGLTGFLMILIILAAATGTFAETVVHSETFTTTANADTLLTTADWDTSAGQIRLHPQGLLTIGTFSVVGEAYAAVWKDNRVLLATGSGNSLLVIDPTDPATPALVKNHALPASARHITLNGDWAHVSLGSGLGIQLVNVADVALPVSGTRIDLGSFTGQSVVVNNWIYAAAYNGGVGVVEITDPNTPVALPSSDLNAWVRWVAVQGNFLFLAADADLTVMSLATAAAPDSVANLPVSGTAFCVTTSGTFAYVGGTAGLDIVDISQPTNPQLLSSLSLGGGSAYHIAVQGDSLFVANGNNGLNIIDISDPAQPQVLANRLAADNFYHTLLQDDLAWASNGNAGLLVLQADAQGLDRTRNLAVSTNVNTSADPVLRANLVADYADSIRFEVTTNGGGTWLDIVPDGTWLGFEVQGDDLRWRATLVPTGPFPGPVCNSLTLTFDRLQSFGEITGVLDVPSDTGGQVRVTWDASRFDAAGQEHLVTEYSLYRRYDAAKSVAPAYPPGSWEYLLTVPADQEANYAATVPTLADSAQSGTNWSVFFVRARTTTVGTFFDSPPDSGYSLNNLAPAPPTGFFADYSVGLGVQLSWDVSPDPDFAHFRLYRVSSPMDLPTPSDLYQVITGTSFFDDTQELWYYHLTVVNLAGLESPPAPQAAGVGVVPASGGFLTQNVPNPFNPATRIAYEVPTGGRPVLLEVYDFRGHLVAVLEDGFVPAGEHTSLWRGQDRQGRTVASGQYTCRLRCGDKVTTMKMTLVR